MVVLMFVVVVMVVTLMRVNTLRIVCQCATLQGGHHALNIPLVRGVHLDPLSAQEAINGLSHAPGDKHLAVLHEFQNGLMFGRPMG